MLLVSAASLETYVPVWACYIRTLTSDFTVIFFAGVRLASAMTYPRTTFGFFLFFPWDILPLQSDMGLSCDHGRDYAS